MGKINLLSTEILSNNWYTLKKVTYEYTKSNGEVQVQQREAYDRGNGAAIMLYNKEQGTVVLTRQFRLPTYINGNETGMLIEACAGLLDKDSPEECIRREAEEETGYIVKDIQQVYATYMSPGSVTEILHLFIAAYTKDMKANSGGGLEHEQEDIEVMELPFEEALQMIRTGAIQDAKTIILLQHLRLYDIL